MYYEDHILTMLGLVSPDQPTTYRRARAEREALRSKAVRPNPHTIEELRYSILRAVHGRGINVRLDKDADSLTVTGPSRQWFIHISPDPESAAFYEDEPFARPSYRAAGKINDPEGGPMVDRKFEGNSLNAHYDAVARWINSYRSIEQGFDKDAPGAMDQDGQIHYQDSKPETPYDGFTGAIGESLDFIVDYHGR